jgi:hypothetical protein
LAWSKSKDYWRVVLAKREKHEEWITAKKAKVIKIEEALARPGEPPFCNRKYYEFVCRPPAHYDPAPEQWGWRSYDEPYESKHEYARGVRKLEMADARRKSSRRSLSKVCVDAVDQLSPNTDDGRDDGAARAIGPWQQGGWPIDHDEWEARGFSVQTTPDRRIVYSGDIDALGRSHAKSPGKSVGRPPIGERAMSSTERSRKHRNRRKVET